MAFSVVIPVYNRPEKLLRAINSVLAQEFGDFEVVIVDDGSTDNTKSILANIRDPRLRIISHDVNRGGSAARNTGIRHSRGRFVAFLDSDDEWLPCKLSKNLSLAMRLNGRWVAFNEVKIVTDENVRATNSGKLIVSDVDNFLFVRRGAIQTSAVFLLRELAQEVLFDEALPRLQDWDFYLRLAASGAVFYAQSDVLTVHHAMNSPDRISSRLDPDWLVDWICERKGIVSDRAVLGFLANKVAPEAVSVGRRWDAFRWLLPGLLLGTVPLRNAAIELLRLSVPKKIFQEIRRIVG